MHAVASRKPRSQNKLQLSCNGLMQKEELIILSRCNLLDVVQGSFGHVWPKVEKIGSQGPSAVGKNFKTESEESPCRLVLKLKPF